ncbi:unnamed protein product [Moneuplotes crassus]|uniref:Uncharacterized protein n=1 Tax=Euplotes crassus TaxID=5936 RepID=A0AAD1Y2I5_EUPCR|nr:unnamed protein product [Moneuplotes crassus]
MFRFQTPKKYEQGEKETRCRKYTNVEFYDRSDFDQFTNQQKFKVKKVKKKRMDRTPSPIVFDINQDLYPLV